MIFFFTTLLIVVRNQDAKIILKSGGTAGDVAQWWSFA
jgi:hypothetical protein